MPKGYDRMNERFEKAVKQMQNNLQYLAGNDKVSEKFIRQQNSIIKTIIDFQNETEELISTLELELLEITLSKTKEYKQLEDIKECFEAICIIHGIMDLQMWMRKGKDLLVSEAVFMYRKNATQLSYNLMDFIDKLPKEEKKTIKAILYKNL